MSQYCIGGATNKALRNKTGSSRGRVKRGRGRGGSGVTTRGTHFERYNFYLHGSVNRCGVSLFSSCDKPTGPKH